MFSQRSIHEKMLPMKRIDGGITAAHGFLASGVACGIKKTSELDLALIVSERKSTAAGVFTLNRFMAPPLHVTREHLSHGFGQAIVANSGNANSCTGGRGKEDAREMARHVGRGLKIAEDLVFVASTGVIGEPLPMPRIRRAIPIAVKNLSREGGKEAARAIMTTDTIPKEVAYTEQVGGVSITVGGMTKGAGMIHPRMATMLAFLSTDATISAEALQRALREAVNNSFNLITVDGETSTNDMVLCLANGLSGGEEIRPGSLAFRKFSGVLSRVCADLARMVVQDGEGATKSIEISVTHATSRAEAEKIAFALAHSPLVKTALRGGDPNWGRIMAVIGAVGKDVSEKKVTISFGKIPVVKRGMRMGEKAEQEAASHLAQEVCSLSVNLGMGKEGATVWTCDLSEEYVRINAAYRS